MTNKTSGIIVLCGVTVVGLHYTTKHLTWIASDDLLLLYFSWGFVSIQSVIIKKHPVHGGIQAFCKKY